MGSGDLLLEVRDHHQYNKLSKLVAFGDIPVSVGPHRSMNTVRGVIADMTCLNFVRVNGWKNGAASAAPPPAKKSQQTSGPADPRAAARADRPEKPQSVLAEWASSRASEEAMDATNTPSVSQTPKERQAVVQTDLSVDHMKAVSIENCTVSEAGTQTETSMQYLEALHQNSQTLSSELQALKKKKLEFGEEALRDDDGKVSFYTGLPSFSVLAAMYQLVEPAVRHTPQNGLEIFEEFLMKPLIVWPSRNEIRKTMPQAFFDSFGEKVAVVIDCFEIKLERPSSMLPRCETWSEYKGSNTAKYLIGICPQGVVSFV
ncbi:uncharacterized protein LOC125942029 [Dermacentor silvarum]|uniref:uncharacterized protein LOC125942029 n=1 Tax=Dermacentor silvarum TaxID=543639 RepID=UPI002100C037|nr:uncharacterized protein LOC125942029 [Dermacentor silvarum]